MDRLAQIVPDAYASEVQLRTLQRRIKAPAGGESERLDPRAAQKGDVGDRGNMNSA